MAGNDQIVLSTTGQLMSVEAMKAIIWAGWVLCLIGFCTRSYIRWLCFRRLLPEDWLMLLVLGIQLGTAIVAQLRLHLVYEMEDVGNGLIPIPPTFMEDVPKALHGVFAQAVLCITGVYIIKAGFLIFFYRLGHVIIEYRIFWYAVAFVTLASYGITMGLVEYKCTLSSVDVIFFQCTSKEDIAREWKNMIAYCTLDAVSDVLILCLPITILWNVRLSLRKKLMLAGIFGLTMFTVAVTIIRGTIQHGRIASDFTQSQNIAWVYFWISIEFITAYIIACLVSFRMLFVRNEKVSSAQKAAALAAAHNQRNNNNLNNLPPGLLDIDGRRPSGSKEKSSRRKLLDSLLDTFHSWEGTTRHSGDNVWLNGTLPSGRMSVDFMHYEPGSVTTTSSTTHYHPYQSYTVAAGAGSGGGVVVHGGGGGGGGNNWPLYDHESQRPESAKTLTAHECQEVHHVGGDGLVTRPESVKTVGQEHVYPYDGGFQRPSGW